MATQEIQSRFARIKRFLREVKAELKKVSWPGRQELTAYTGVVFISVLVVALLLWFMDTGFTFAFKLFIK
jgi:preprotein translocase subunit SecE